jgi:hypothetical protein
MREESALWLLRCTAVAITLVVTPIADALLDDLGIKLRLAKAQ